MYLLCIFQQVVKGSHRCGRIEHEQKHGQTVANQERVDQIVKEFELIYAEQEPGKIHSTSEWF